MKRLKEIEQLMMLSSRRENPEGFNAFEKTVYYYRYFDSKFNTAHCQIINLLYNVKERKSTYEGIALKMGMSDNALRRHRADYASMFYYCLTNSETKKSA